MKRILLLGGITLVLALCVIGGVAVGLSSSKAQVCWSKNPGNLIGCYFAPAMALSVHVSGSVDEVMVLRAGDDLVMGRVVTNGQDVTQTIYLPTTDKYYLTVRKGEQTRTGRPQGFNTNEGSGMQQVFSIDHLEGPLSGR